MFEAFDDFSVSACSTRLDCGTNALHKHLEHVVATFVKKEAAFVFNMGYGTNSTVIPALMGAGSLVVSDSLNHASIVNGARASGAVIRVFRHNSASNLEKILREAIVDGQPRTHRPWTKILVMVEGVYSMEGEICNLKDIVQVAKKCVCFHPCVCACVRVCVCVGACWGVLGCVGCVGWLWCLFLVVMSVCRWCVGRAAAEGGSTPQKSVCANRQTVCMYVTYVVRVRVCVFCAVLLRVFLRTGALVCASCVVRQVQVLHVRRRGALYRRCRANGPWCVRALRCGPR